MFPRLTLLAYIFNHTLLTYLALPFGVLTLVCLVVSLLLIKKDTNIKLGNPTNLLNAIGFRVIYVVILFAIFYSNKFFGESRLYYSALIAGLGETDTITVTISMAKFFLDGKN
jgi:uncharacterized membrane protein (DUF4010 family)